MAYTVNQLIRVLVKNIKSTDGDLLPEISSYYTTHMTPMYSTPLKVREVAGAYLEDVSDSILNQLILKYSLMAEQMAVCDRLADEKWSYYTSQWVTFKVTADALLNSPTYLGESGGKIYKKLGDFAISKDNKDDGGSGPVNKMLNRVDCEAFKLENAVKFCKAPLLTCDPDDIKNDYNPLAMQSVVKSGGRYGYPAFGRMFDGEGNHPGMTGWIKNADRISMTNRR